MYVTVKKFQSNSVYATEEKAVWPLDSAPMGIKSEPTAKFFIWCYKFQVQDYVVSKFTSFGFLNSFTSPPPYPCPHYFSLAQQSAQ